MLHQYVYDAYILYQTICSTARVFGNIRGFNHGLYTPIFHHNGREIHQTSLVKEEIKFRAFSSLFFY